MTATDGVDPVTLQTLTISPIGWIDGAFERQGKRGLLGGKAAAGAVWPANEPSAPPVARAGTSWLQTFALAGLGWLTEHENLLPAQRPAQQAEEPEPSRLSRWLSQLDPNAAISKLSKMSLVPEFLSTSFPKLTFAPY